MIAGLDDLGLELLSPRDDAKRGGLVRTRIPEGVENTKRVLHALFDRDVVVDSRGDALRISPHFFNNEDDVDVCLRELRAVL